MKVKPGERQAGNGGPSGTKSWESGDAVTDLKNNEVWRTRADDVRYRGKHGEKMNVIEQIEKDVARFYPLRKAREEGMGVTCPRLEKVMERIHVAPDMTDELSAAQGPLRTLGDRMRRNG